MQFHFYDLLADAVIDPKEELKRLCTLFSSETFWPNTGMSRIGISPTARNAHTTKENLYLDEVKPFWDLLLMVLQMRS